MPLRRAGASPAGMVIPDHPRRRRFSKPVWKFVRHSQFAGGNIDLTRRKQRLRLCNFMPLRGAGAGRGPALAAGPLPEVPLAIWCHAQHVPATYSVLASHTPRRVNPWRLQHDLCFFSQNMAAIESVIRRLPRKVLSGLAFTSPRWVEGDAQSFG